MTFLFSFWTIFFFDIYTIKSLINIWEIKLHPNEIQHFRVRYLSIFCETPKYFLIFFICSMFNPYDIVNEGITKSKYTQLISFVKYTMKVLVHVLSWITIFRTIFNNNISRVSSLPLRVTKRIMTAAVKRGDITIIAIFRKLVRVK